MASLVEVLPENSSVVWKPNPGPQTEFLSCPEHEVLLGGAAGGGKSDGLLMSGVRWHENRYHRAILFRKTFPELKDLIRRSYEIFPAFGARYKQSSHEWIFPSGAIFEFGSMERQADVYKYKRAWNWAGFDELTHWPANGIGKDGFPINEEYQLIVGSRLRTPAHSGLPIEARASSNPGGAGHAWVRQRFRIPDNGYRSNYFDPITKRWRCFIPARVKDNPYLAGTSYEQDLDALPDDLRKMLKDGRWDVMAGAMFSEFNWHHHTCDPFPIGATWRLYRGGDDGFNAPACVLWAADHDQRTYIVGELYRSGMNAETMAEETMRRDRMVSMSNAADEQPFLNPNSLAGTMDCSSFNESGIGSRGTGRAQIMNRMGCNWQPSQKGAGSRVAGWGLVHSALQKKLPDGKPALIIFRSCTNLIRTLPVMPKDKHNPDDVDTTCDDHAGDALRNVLQHRPNLVSVGKVKGF